MTFHDVSNDGLLIAMELCVLKAWWRNDCVRWMRIFFAIKEDHTLCPDVQDRCRQFRGDSHGHRADRGKAPRVHPHHITRILLRISTRRYTNLLGGSGVGCHGVCWYQGIPSLGTSAVTEPPLTLNSTQPPATTTTLLSTVVSSIWWSAAAVTGGKVRVESEH